MVKQMKKLDEPNVHNTKLMSLICSVGKCLIQTFKSKDPAILQMNIDSMNWMQIRPETFGRIWEGLCNIQLHLDYHKRLNLKSTNRHGFNEKMKNLLKRDSDLTLGDVFKT